MAGQNKKEEFQVGLRRIIKNVPNPDRTMEFVSYLDPTHKLPVAIIRLLAQNDSGGMSEVLGWSRSGRERGDKRPDESLT
ncbi:MAG: hypothetical protein AAB874_04150, partial [Patescibacteria group bacterium]